jgi:hypothetical protein
VRGLAMDLDDFGRGFQFLMHDRDGNSSTALIN